MGTWVFRTCGDGRRVAAYDHLLLESGGYWLAREVVLYLKRTLKRLDVSSRSLVALIEPGSCFAGTLLELALAADRCYMLDGEWDDNAGSGAASARLTGMNFGPLPMVNGLSRLEVRFLDVARLRECVGQELDAPAARDLGLATFIPDAIDWEDEVRLALEERAQLFARCADRDGGESAFRRPGNYGKQNFRAAKRLAKLDLPAAQRLGQPGGVAAIRHRGAARLRPGAGVAGGRGFLFVAAGGMLEARTVARWKT